MDGKAAAKINLRTVYRSEAGVSKLWYENKCTCWVDNNGRWSFVPIVGGLGDCGGGDGSTGWSAGTGL